MTEEFNLSEKIKEVFKGDYESCWLHRQTEKQIKEFIKRRNGLLLLFLSGEIAYKEFMKEWNKLVGDNLKGGD